LFDGFNTNKISEARMGKLVKFCNSCEEGFAEKFTFCPNCGGKLSVYEMNPIQEETKIVEEPKSAVIEQSAITEIPPLTQTPIIETPIIESSPIVESLPIAEEKMVADEIVANEPIFSSKGENETIWDDEVTEIEVEKPKANVSVVSGLGLSNEYEAMPSSMYRQNVSNSEEEEDYHLTIIEDPKRNERRVMLLGYGLLILALFGGWWVYSLFAKELNVAALGGNDDIISMIPEVEPVPVEKEVLEKNKDKGGGGGGGGREEEDPVSKGRLASQTEHPLINPDKSIVRRDNPELRQERAATQGKEFNEKQSDENYGDPNSTNLSKLSNGQGFGGGQGAGNGQGQGNGRGTGRGNGDGSGMGNGKGNGRGDGEGDDNGTGRDEPPPAAPVKTPKPTPPPTPKPAGVTQELRILSKPKPGYTDAARQNNVTGVVRLKVTFSANGSIAGITPISGLPYGLTEQAIAAARGIRFEPKKIDGVPQTVSKTVEFSFTIY
jgi:TonB family protein